MSNYVPKSIATDDARTAEDFRNEDGSYDVVGFAVAAIPAEIREQHPALVSVIEGASNALANSTINTAARADVAAQALNRASASIYEAREMLALSDEELEEALTPPSFAEMLEGLGLSPEPDGVIDASAIN